MHVAKIIFVVLEVLLLFNLLIAAHELGHFLAAKWRGLIVERFAIWFGPAMIKKTVDGIEYRLGCIPFGGYVALPQMGSMEAVEGKPAQQPGRTRVSPLDKAIVAAAGPFFSFLLAIVLATVVWAVGRPVSSSDMTTRVGYVFKGDPADMAGMLAGDTILEVDGKKVSRFAANGHVGETIVWNIATATHETIPILINRNGQLLTLTVRPAAPERAGLGRKYLKQIGIIPFGIPRVAKILPDKPAEAAGVKSGDYLLSANGIPLLSPMMLKDFLDGTAAGNPVIFSVRTGTSVRDVEVLPVVPTGENFPRIGIEWDLRGETTNYHQPPGAQIYGSVMTVVKTVEALFSKGTGVTASHLSGPIGIMRVYYLLFESPEGWRLVLWFSVLLNVNLAVMNLLPLPVLDGGHIVMAGVEALRGKPISPGMMEAIGFGCAVFLLGFMLYVSFYDVLDIF